MIPVHDFAVGADDGGAEAVGDESAFGFDGEGEKVGEPGKVGGGGGGELPASEESWRVRVRDGEGVVAENFWGVVLGVKGNAQESGIGERRIRSELFVDFGEVATDAWAEIGEGAAGVDEGEEQNFSAILLQGDSLAALIGEGKIGDFFAARGCVERAAGGRWSGVGVGGDFHILQPVVGCCVFVLGCRGLDDDFGGDGVTGLQVIQRCLGFDFVGHGHGVHEAGDGVAVDEGGLGLRVDGNDAAGEGIAFRGGGIWGLTRRKKEHGGDDKDEGDGDNTGVLFDHVVFTLTHSL